MKFAIVGAAGFIGSHLTRELIKNNQIIVLKRSFDDIHRITDLKDKIKFYDIDIENLNTILAKEKPNYIINLATNFGRGDVSLSEIIETNLVFASKLADAAKIVSAKYINFDTSLDSKTNIYASTKHYFRQLLQDFYSPHMVVLNLQLEYVFGEDDDLSKFIPMAIDKLNKNEELNMSAGEQELDFIYIKDCVSAICHVIELSVNYSNGFYNFEIGTGETMKLRELIELIAKLAKSKSKINFGSIPYRPHEQMYSKADLKLLKGWEPTFSISDAIRQIIKNK